MKTTFCFVLIILIGLVSWFGCVNNSIAFDVAFSNKTILGYKEKESDITYYSGATIFDTDKKLQSFCVKWNNGAFNEKASDYSSLLNQKLREYNEEFFQNKALIIFSNCKWNWAREPQVKKVSVKNTVLVLEINLKRGAYSDIAESCTFFIEIDKADCKDITNILVEETTRIK
ncbi:MAG: hypothetical protein IJD50_04075 [Clostridia bacterium]|nr:hypothetical protein [Clostridia bacterium]